MVISPFYRGEKRDLEGLCDLLEASQFSLALRSSLPNGGREE